MLRAVPGWAVMTCALVALSTHAGNLWAAPAKPSMAIFPLEAKTGMQVSTVELLSDYLAGEVRQVGAFSKVVSSKDIETVLSLERQKQLLDCTSQSCLAELAGALGVDYVLNGNVGKIGRFAILNVKIVEARSGLTVASFSQTLCGHSEENLVMAMRPAVQKMVLEAKLVDPGAFPNRVMPQEDCNQPNNATTAEARPPSAAPPRQENTESTASQDRSSRPPLRLPLLGSGVAGLLGGLATGAASLLGMTGALVVGLLLYASADVAHAVPTPGLERTNRFIAVRAVPPLGLAAAATGLALLGLIILAGGGALVGGSFLAGG